MPLADKSTTKFRYRNVAQVQTVPASIRHAAGRSPQPMRWKPTTPRKLRNKHVAQTTLSARLPPPSFAMAAACHLIIQPCGKCAGRSALDDRRRVFREVLLLDQGLRDRCTIDLSEPHELACVSVSGRLHAAQMDQLLRHVQSSFTCYRTFGVAVTGTTAEAHSGAMIGEWSRVAGSGGNGGSAAIEWCGICSKVGVWFMRCGQSCSQSIDGGLFGLLATSDGLEQRFACNRCSQWEPTAVDIVLHLLQAHGQQTEHESPDRQLALSSKGQTTGNWLTRLMNACCCGGSGRGESDA